MSDTDSIGAAISRFGDWLSGKLGINTGSVPANNWLEVNLPTTTDSLAEVLVSTSATTRKGIVVQGTSGQAQNLQEWQSSTGTLLANVSSTGTLSGPMYTYGQRFNTSNFSGSATITAGAGPAVGFTGTSGGTLSLPAANAGPYFMIVRDVGGNANANPISIAPNGTDLINGANATIKISNNFGSKLLISDGSSKWLTGEFISAGTPTTADSVADNVIGTTAIGRKGLVVQGTSGQTANLLEIQNSAGTVEHSFSTSGCVLLSSLLNGTVRYSNQAFSGSGTISAFNGCLVRFTGTSGGTLSLPAANSAGMSNCIYFIQDEGGSAAASNIVISPNGSDKINGVNASVSITTNYGGKILYSNGTNWFVLSGS
jgi:hypothetical protein